MTAADVYRALWRHKWFILVLTALCVGAAWYATVQQTQRYEAAALVRVQERGPAAARYRTGSCTRGRHTRPTR